MPNPHNLIENCTPCVNGAHRSCTTIEEVDGARYVVDCNCKKKDHKSLR